MLEDLMSICNRNNLIKSKGQPNCHILNSHDDYGIVSRVPKGSTSVVTNLRHPFDRVLSAYEFSIENAASFMPIEKKYKIYNEASKSSRGPLQIWPWKHLVPWMLKDLTSRYVRRNVIMEEPNREVSLYDSPQYVMPLHDFIYSPMAFDLVHNGATFQIAGITNKSCSQDVEVIRNCVLQFEDLGLDILDVAKKRIEKMFFVGLTDEHEDSAKIFATLIVRQLSSKWVLPDHLVGGVRLNASTDYKEYLVKDLMTSYHSCVKSQRKEYARQHNISLSCILPSNINLKGQTSVAQSLVKDILHFNKLDLALYSHAEEIFNRERIVISNMVEGKKILSNEQEKLYKILDIRVNIGYMLLLVVSLVGGCINLFICHYIKSQKNYYAQKTLEFLPFLKSKNHFW